LDYSCECAYQFMELPVFTIVLAATLLIAACVLPMLVKRMKDLPQVIVVLMSLMTMRAAKDLQVDPTITQ
jgi:hypothetical protein